MGWKKNSSPGVRDFVALFTFEHLLERDPELAEISRPFCEMARKMGGGRYSHDGVLLLTLDALMKAKDAAVRLEIVSRTREKEYNKAMGIYASKKKKKGEG